MEDIIKKLMTEANITEEQAKKAVEVLVNYVKEKVPMLENYVENFFKN